MLLIRGKAKWFTHEASGAQFEIRAIGAEEYERLRSQHMVEGKLQYIAWCATFAAAAIVAWRGVGDETGELPCTAEHLAEFGRAHAGHIMPWITDRATELGRFVTEEVQAAKNA